LWWYGYDNASGNWGLEAYDVLAGEVELQIVAPMSDAWWSSGGLNGMGSAQPFALGTERVVWGQWGPVTGDVSVSGFTVHAWPYAGSEATIVAIDPERDHLHPMLTENDTLITASYLRSEGCSVPKCDLSLTAYPATGAARELAPGAKPTLLLEPVVTGNRVVWLDHRDGLYQVWAVDVAAPAEGPVRITSDKAQVGTLSTIAAGPRGAVWADRRTGHWRLYSRAW
jgi:hypothetical protein